MASNKVRDISLLIALIFVGAALVIPNFLGYSGCRKYAENLTNCKPYKCSQKVKGFKTDLGYFGIKTIEREIIGSDSDKFFDEKKCEVIETDDKEAKEVYKCEYVADDLPKVAERADILFGNIAVPKPESSPAKNTDTTKPEEALRAEYLNRNDITNKSCSKVN